MVRPEQKQAEKRVLEAVYDLALFPKIEDSEVPDFLLHYTISSESPSESSSPRPLGVEVTELFPSESDARAFKRANYIPQIFETGRYIHKDDHAELKVSEMTVIRGADGSQEPIRAIIREVPTLQQYMDDVALRIRDKEGRLQEYSRRCSSVDLIIRDFYATAELSKRTLLDFLAIDLRSVLTGTEFREIFLITHSPGPSPSCIPLKGNLLFREVRALLVGCKHLKNLEVPKMTISDALCGWLNARGMQVVDHSVEGRTEIEFGAWRIVFDSDHRMEVHDNLARPPDGSGVPVLGAAFPSDLFEQISEFADSHVIGGMEGTPRVDG